MAEPQIHPSVHRLLINFNINVDSLPGYMLFLFGKQY